MCFSWLNLQLRTDFGVDTFSRFEVSGSTVKYNALRMSVQNDSTIWSELLGHQGHTFMISLLSYCTLHFLFQKFEQNAEVLIKAGILG
jgi:hypothetical protein